MAYIIIRFKIQIYYISSRSPLAPKVCENPSVVSDSLHPMDYIHSMEFSMPKYGYG